MVLIDKYKQLSIRIGLGKSARIQRLFSMIASDQEAEILLILPSDAIYLSKKIGINQDTTEKLLHNLFIKGLIFPSFKTDPPTYRMVRDIVQFHDASILWPDAPREFLDLWQEWIETEWPGLARKIQKKIDKPFARVIPIGAKIEAQSQVLAFEDVVAIINSADEVAVTNCPCRLTARQCNKPVEACIQINKAASYAISRGTGRRLTKEEAIELIHRLEEKGLVHTTFNTKDVNHVICNCCDCCCQYLPELIKRGTSIISPSRFEALVSNDECVGCEICVDGCFFKAILMRNNIAVIDSEKCMGCGVCSVACPTDAIIMIEVRNFDQFSK